MGAFEWFPDALGLLWGLLGGGFNFFMTRRILKKGLDSKHVLLLVFLKPLTHLIILVLAALVSLWFMVSCGGGGPADAGRHVPKKLLGRQEMMKWSWKSHRKHSTLATSM